VPTAAQPLHIPRRRQSASGSVKSICSYSDPNENYAALICADGRRPLPL